jgi:hypothetical protein
MYLVFSMFISRQTFFFSCLKVHSLLMLLLLVDLALIAMFFSGGSNNWLREFS